MHETAGILHPPCKAFSPSTVILRPGLTSQNVVNILGCALQVSPDDFLYIERIGEGGFGRVVQVKKKSTQAHYAMKIQLKTALLDTFSDDPTRIDHERYFHLESLTAVFASFNRATDFGGISPLELLLFITSAGTAALVSASKGWYFCLARMAVLQAELL